MCNNVNLHKFLTYLWEFLGYCFHDMASKYFRSLVEAMPRHLAVAIKVREPATLFSPGVSNSVVLQCILDIRRKDFVTVVILPGETQIYPHENP